MLVSLLFAASVAAGAPDVAGLWRTPGDGGLVRVSHCGQGLCGTLLTSNRLRQDPTLADSHNRDEALRTRRLKGLELFHGFKGSGGAWRDGTIYNPHDGGTYHASLELTAPDRLKVTGCLFGPLCQTQVWERAPSDAAER
jgi:uncharacterized protein (DUF2147 family)